MREMPRMPTPGNSQFLKRLTGKERWPGAVSAFRPWPHGRGREGDEAPRIGPAMCRKDAGRDSAIHRSNNKSNIFMDKRVAVKLKKLYNLEKAKIF